MIQEQCSDVFYARLQACSSREKFPLRVLFELTYACNFNCVHCYNVKEKKQELTTQQIKEILRQLVDNGCFHVGFTGGEPLLRKDIFQILRFAKDIGLRMTILTNAFLVDSFAADKLLELGAALNKVDVSFLGIRTLTFEGITQKKGSLARVKKAVRLLRERDITVMLKYTFMRQNKDEFIGIKKFADSLGCKVRCSPVLSAKANGDTGPLRYRLSVSERMGLFKNVENKNTRCLTVAGTEINSTIFRCGAGVNEATINPYGELKFCPEINRPVYPILGSSLMVSWGNMKDFVNDLGRLDYVCRACPLVQFCDSCPARMSISANGQYVCNQYDKEVAIARAQKTEKWREIKEKL